MSMKILFFILGTMLLIQHVQSNVIGVKTKDDENYLAARQQFFLASVFNALIFHGKVLLSTRNIFQPLIANNDETSENSTKTIWKEKLQKLKILLELESRPGDESNTAKKTFLKKLLDIFDGFKNPDVITGTNLSALDKDIVKAQENLSKEIEESFAIFSNESIAEYEIFQQSIPPGEAPAEQEILQITNRIKNGADIEQTFDLLEGLFYFDGSSEGKQ